MGADEEIHHDNGNPRAKTTWRMRVLPKTLHTNPVTVAASQGQGICKDVLSRSVYKSQVPVQVNKAGTGQISKRNTALVSFVQLADEFATLFNFNF